MLAPGGAPIGKVTELSQIRKEETPRVLIGVRSTSWSLKGGIQPAGTFA